MEARWIGAAAQAAEAAKSRQAHANDGNREGLASPAANFDRKPDLIFQCSPRSTPDSKVAEHDPRAGAVTYSLFRRQPVEAYNNVVPQRYAARGIATCTRLRPRRLAA